jgi:hypothetical protein
LRLASRSGANAVQQHREPASRPDQIPVQVAVVAAADVQGHAHVPDAVNRTIAVGGQRDDLAVGETAGVAVWPVISASNSRLDEAAIGMPSSVAAEPPYP